MSVNRFTDQMGEEVLIPIYPRRIISLVPSQTEVLAHLGLASRVVGITKFCVHPPAWKKSKTIIGGTKNFNLDVIDTLKPDLIIGNKEENYREGIEILKEQYPVWMSDIVAMEDTLAMIRHIGEITAKEAQAESLANEISKSLSTLQPLPGTSVLYLIWKKPWMAVARGTFINNMLSIAGFRNVIESQSRYPELSDREIKNLNPEMVLLSSEPYPFSEKHIYEIKELLPDAHVLLVDGQLFSWYGPRMLYLADYLKTLKLPKY